MTELEVLERKKEALEQLTRIEQEKVEVKENLDRDNIELSEWLSSQNIDDEHIVLKNLSIKFNMNLSDAKKSLESFPIEYIVQDKTVPDIVKDLRKYKRTLKGENKYSLNKSIESLVFAYSDHLEKCIDSIYWLNKYKIPLKNMSFTEMDLKKMHSVKDKESRRTIIDMLCKYWEVNLDSQDLPYNTEYAQLHKQMRVHKREFRKCIKEINHQVIRKNLNGQLKDTILKSVCSNPGISAREIHEQLNNKLYQRSSPNMISKLVKGLGITNVEGEYYKFDDSIRKSLSAYTAAFIDSDGYITLDSNYNPRVGLVATGNRGKAFMIEMQKSLGYGKLHLDQKSPQNTRLVNRLNFYSQDDVRKLLTDCRPHFRLKGPQADILLELIRIKKGFKKQDWAKSRYVELFKLMKWNNHQDAARYDWQKYDINIENISKYEDNNKMVVMDDIESIVKEE